MCRWGSKYFVAPLKNPPSWKLKCSSMQSLALLYRTSLVTMVRCLFRRVPSGSRCMGKVVPEQLNRQHRPVLWLQWNWTKYGRVRVILLREDSAEFCMICLFVQVSHNSVDFQQVFLPREVYADVKTCLNDSRWSTVRTCFWKAAVRRQTNTSKSFAAVV